MLSLKCFAKVTFQHYALFFWRQNWGRILGSRSLLLEVCLWLPFPLGPIEMLLPEFQVRLLPCILSRSIPLLKTPTILSQLFPISFVARTEHSFSKLFLFPLALLEPHRSVFTEKGTWSIILSCHLILNKAILKKTHLFYPPKTRLTLLTSLWMKEKTPAESDLETRSCKTRQGPVPGCVSF